MTLIHVLGGASLLILVAVSTVIRAGIGLDRAEGAPAKPETVEAAAEAVEEPVEEPVAVLVAPPFGPLLDRMGP
jgi:hypothetical protein